MLHKFVSLGDQKSLFLSDFSHTVKLSSSIEDGQEPLILVVEQHELASQFALFDKFDIAEQFFERNSLIRKNLMILSKHIL